MQKTMSVSQLIHSLGKELDDLRTRVASLEGLLGVVGVEASAQKSSNVDESCRMCGITWQLGVTCYPAHMAGKRHKKNLAKLSKVDPPSPTPGATYSGSDSDAVPTLVLADTVKSKVSVKLPIMLNIDLAKVV